MYDEHKPIFEGKFNYLSIIELIKTYTPTANIVLEYDFNENPEILLNDYNKLKELFN